MNIPQKVIYCSYISNLIGYIYSALESRLFMSRDFIFLTNLIVLLWCNCPFILQGFILFSQINLSICAAQTEINV